MPFRRYGDSYRLWITQLQNHAQNESYNNLIYIMSNDLQEYKKETNYLATNIYADYEETFNEAHYFKGMIGYNYEQST